MFYREGALIQAAADGSGVRNVETLPSFRWHSFDVSPNGQQLVYSACNSSEGWGDPISASVSHDELVRANIDGTVPTRLTRNFRFDNYPSWSPDGARIAFISQSVYSRAGKHLRTIAADGSDLRQIGIDVTLPRSATPHWSPEWGTAPQWSPDSQRLAVTAVRYVPSADAPAQRAMFYLPSEIADAPAQRAIFTVGADGSDPRRLGADVVSGPTWAPDGRRLAYARAHDGQVVLATIAADGTDERIVATIEDWAWSINQWQWPLNEPLPDPRLAWVRTVAWSPDGAHLLYSCGPWLCISRTDGTLVGQSSSPALMSANMGAWSPDGGRVAVRGVGSDRRVVLYTMAPDGGDRRAVA